MVNPNPRNFRLTSNAEMDALQPGDNTVEVVGAITSVETRATANVSSNVPLRCVLNNGGDRKIRVLFWGAQISQFQHQINRQYIHIKRGRVTPANMAYYKPAEGLMKIEITITSNSTIDILGPLDNQPIPVAPVPQPVVFRDLGMSNGLIVTSGYIKVQIEAVVARNASYGSGALTDGMYRLLVHVTTFVEAQSPAIGTHVRIQGIIRNNGYGTLFLQVTNMQQIQIIEGIMDADGLAAGFLPLPVPEVAQNQADPALPVAQGANLAVALAPVEPPVAPAVIPVQMNQAGVPNQLIPAPPALPVAPVANPAQINGFGPNQVVVAPVVPPVAPALIPGQIAAPVVLPVAPVANLGQINQVVAPVVPPVAPALIPGQIAAPVVLPVAPAANLGQINQALAPVVPPVASGVIPDHGQRRSRVLKLEVGDKSSDNEVKGDVNNGGEHAEGPTSKQRRLDNDRKD